jgi:hypothetical protein
MAGAIKKLKSLKGRSLDELRVRAAQGLAAARERYGLSPQSRVPTDDALFKLLKPESRVSAQSPRQLLAQFRKREHIRFFAAFNNREETVKELRRRFGNESEERAIQRAERILSGRFNLLGFSDLSFGNPVDWHLEPVAQRRAPLTHWSRINYLDAELAGDKKIIWELNRHQYFATLGRAYWYTGDERYSEAFAAHLLSWVKENPPKLGINWASSLEVAFRSISWLWAFHFFKDSEHLTPELYLCALKFLYIHARHLETYLSTYFSPNTHLTGEALGLFYLGTLLDEFREAEGWRRLGLEILLNELERHVRPDGVYFEQTSYYHRYTTDFYTHLLILQQANGRGVDARLQSKLTALLDHLMYITRPDGRTPLFGDDDGGRLVKLDERAANDFRAALSTGAVLFGRGDYKQVAGELAEESLWLLGTRGAAAFDKLDQREPSQASKGFTDGGYYVMRDGWGADANYLLIDCGPHGTLNCGHAHADALSFELAARGRTMLVDPGTYTYTGSIEARSYFRSSLSHNTLVIDGESSSRSDGPFSWQHIARARALRFLSTKRFDLFEGEHDGYARLPQPAKHTRSLLFVKNNYWIMRDRIESAGEHTCELRFHYAHGARPLIEKGAGLEAAAVRERSALRCGMELFAFGDAGEWHETQGWISEAYGSRQPAPVLSFSAATKGSHEFVTFLVPRSAADKESHAREATASGGRAFELLDTFSHDLLLIRAVDAAVISSSLVTSDFEWSWARFAQEGEEPQELLLIQGSALSLYGKEIVSAESPMDYLSLRRSGEDLIVETEASAALTLSSLGARRVILGGEAFETRGRSVRVRGGRVTFAEPARAEDVCLEGVK